MKKPIHAGIIVVSEFEILKWLQFEGGTLDGVRTRFEEFGDRVEFRIRHPDLPEVHMGEQLVIINPVYKVERAGDGPFVFVERIEPPKQNNK